MGVSTKVTLDDVLGEVIPALLAAGLSEAQLRAISADAQRIMGGGGPTRDWIMALALAAAPYGRRARTAFMLAMDELGIGRDPAGSVRDG
jgi:hypothetical protein